MKKLNSVKYVLALMSVLPLDELPLEDRTDNWWDMFWSYLGAEEAHRVKVKICEAR